VIDPFASLAFDNRFVRSLPGDPRLDNQRRQVRNACYSKVAPTRVAAPKLLAVASEVAELLGLPVSLWESPRFAEIFAGNQQLPGMEPYAACYGGHQFGNWAGQLGDGRAITLGELVAPAGRWELQLKGAGPTPYSRSADGRAVVRSSVREFLCSEAMHHLGVPTTRALCLIGTGETVVRDMFYDGNPQAEPGAVVCRVAPSFVRFGNFELLATRGEHALLRTLADYVIDSHFAELALPSAATAGEARYVRWFDEICKRTLEMVVHWMRVGFVHGVMNTDNMSVLGLTIDYGPYGWLEEFDPMWTPNTTDASGRRYRYGQQPQIAIWNLSRFASALLPLVGRAAPLQEVLEDHAKALQARLPRMLHEKLGLAGSDASSQALVDDLPALMERCALDFTNFFRALAQYPLVARGDHADEAAWLAPILPTSYRAQQLTAAERADLAAWLRRYVQQLGSEDLPAERRRARMNALNPKYVLRNYLAQLAIDRAERGDPAQIDELLELCRHPYDEQPGREQFAVLRPEWARHRAGCSMLSCSS
jgi:uncharacterized protein YdiU (UPF0061 family)